MCGRGDISWAAEEEWGGWRWGVNGGGLATNLLFCV